MYKCKCQGERWFDLLKLLKEHIGEAPWVVKALTLHIICNCPLSKGDKESINKVLDDNKLSQEGTTEY